MVKKILIATPCYGDMVTSGYMLSILNTVCKNTNPDLQFSIYTLGNESLVTVARNRCVAYFLAGDFTHLFFIDADIAFDDHLIRRFVEFDKDVVCGLYPRKGILWERLDELDKRAMVSMTSKKIQTRLMSFNYRKDDSDYTTNNGFLKIHYSGTGFMCIKRGVFDRMRQVYPEQNYVSTHATHYPEHFWLFFDTMLTEDKIYLSEDYAFCKKWCAIGGEIWADTTANLTHTGSYRFTGDIIQHFSQLE